MLSESSTSRRAELPLLTLALVLSAASFAPALDGVFVWDDVDLIANNPCVKEMSYLGRNLTSSFWDICNYGADQLAGVANRYYRPVVTTSFMLDYQLWGMDARGYHLTNLLLHLLAVVMAWLLARQLAPGSRLVPTLTALIFAIHPTRAESVSWVSGRTDLLMTLFLLASLCCFVPLLKRTDGPTRLRRSLLWSGAWICFAASLLSKEVALSLAVLLPLLDRLVINRDHPPCFFGNLWRHHLPLFVACALYVLAWLLAQPDHGPKAADMTGVDRLTTLLETLGYYVQALVQPYAPSAQLGAFYQPENPSWIRVGLGALSVAGVAGWAFAVRHRQPLSCWALLFCAATLAPVANLVPHSLYYLAAERFTYAPLWGLGLVAAVAIAGRPVRLRRALISLLALLLATWSVTSFVRSLDYRSALRFWRATADSSLHNPIVQENLALALLEQGEFSEAEHWLREAFVEAKRLDLLDRQLSVQLGRLRLKMLRSSDTRPVELRRVRRFLQRLLAVQREHDPGERPTRIELEVAGLHLAVDPRARAVRQELRKSRRVLLEILGQVSSSLGHDEEAIRQLKQAHRLAPTSAPTLFNLFLAQARAERIEQAERTLQAARQLASDTPAIEQLAKTLELAKVRIARLRRLSETQRAEALRLRAELLIMLKARGRAIDKLRQLVALQPGDRQARAMLALTLAAGGDLDGALQVIDQARADFGPDPGLAELEQQVRQTHGE